MTNVMLVALYALAVWRLSSLVVREHGPADILLRVRTYAGVYAIGEQSNLAIGLSCMWCVSLWVGIVVTVAHGVLVGWAWWLLALPFALSTIAILIESALVGHDSRATFVD